jgi:hypothetical protein
MTRRCRALFATGASAFIQLDRIAKEWIGLGKKCFRDHRSHLQ